MTKNFKRILLAATISLIGFASTIIWYKLSDTTLLTSTSAKPIARLVSTYKDVQKKPTQKIIWQTAIENEVLRVGEAIRTSEDAEARIEFLASATTIELEPDSAIILEESDGQVSLEFIKGNIAVDASSTSSKTKSSITLKNGNKNISIGNSQLTLGKSKSGNLDVQVIKGDVKGFDASQISQIKITEPAPSIPIYVNTKSDEQTKFAWVPLPKGYTVFLESGDKREKMLPVNSATGSGDAGFLLARLSLGKRYYRLKATSADSAQPELTSSTIRTSVLAKIPPVPLAPENKSNISLNKNKNEMDFLWSNPAGFTKVIFELATNPSLTEKLKTEYLSNTTLYKFNIDQSGTYYWRVSGVLEGRKEVVSSPIQMMKIIVQDKILPPLLESPKPDQKHLIDSGTTRDILLTWKNSTGAEKYFVTLEKLGAKLKVRDIASSQKIFEGEFKSLQTVIKDLTVGEYAWTVSAIDNSNQKSLPSEKRLFSIDSIPLIEWADGKLEDDYYYLSLKPSIKLEWKPISANVKYWKINLSHSETDKKYFRKIQNLTSEFNVPKDGLYSVEIEALSQTDKIVAKSNLRIVKVAAAPLLPAPNYQSSVPTEIKASPSGDAQVSWTRVEGAQGYILKIKKTDGSENEYKFSSMEGQLTNLMPGEHKLTLQSVDSHGRTGPESEERKLSVPNVSNMRAPKLKGVKIK